MGAYILVFARYTFRKLKVATAPCTQPLYCKNKKPITVFYASYCLFPDKHHSVCSPKASSVPCSAPCVQGDALLTAVEESIRPIVLVTWEGDLIC